MSNQFQKVCGVSVAGFGTLPLTDGDSTFKPSGKKRDHVAGCNAADGGFTESNVPAELEISMNAKKTLSMQTIGAMEDETITVRTANGVTHVMNKAWCEEQPSLGSDGKVKAKFIANQSGEKSL